jgi:hypothetical protein
MQSVQRRDLQTGALARSNTSQAKPIPTVAPRPAAATARKRVAKTGEVPAAGGRISKKEMFRAHFFRQRCFDRGMGLWRRHSSMTATWRRTCSWAMTGDAPLTSTS